jgi:N-acetylglucosamine kinase-like BadF-type ATPase
MVHQKYLSVADVLGLRDEASRNMAKLIFKHIKKHGDGIGTLGNLMDEIIKQLKKDDCWNASPEIACLFGMMFQKIVINKVDSEPNNIIRASTQEEAEEAIERAISEKTETKTKTNGRKTFSV